MGSPFSFEGDQSMSETKGDAQLEKLQIELRPRLREKDPQRAARKERWQLALALAALFSNAGEARAPKLLHAGRRPLRMCATGDRRSRDEG